MARADVEEVRDIIRPLGFLYRADRLKAIGEKLVRDFGGTVPRGEKDLLSLPGVGPYTANAVRAFAFGEPVAIVDTNVLRVYRRVFSTGPHSTLRGPDKATVEVAKVALPEERARDYNYAMLDFAALQCTHYSPKCHSCPLLEACDHGASRLRDSGQGGLNIKSEAEIEQLYPRPYVHVARALILALVSLGYPITLLFDTPSGAVAEAKLTMDLWSLGGMLSFVISEESASSVRVSGTSTITGSRFAWGKGNRALTSVIQKAGEYLNLLAP